MKFGLRSGMVTIALVVLAASFAFAGKKKEVLVAELKFTVLKESTGQPLRNASVVIHSVDKNGKQSRDGVQLKTNPEGMVSIDGIEYGKIRIQVISPGLQTFGDDYTIDQPKMEFTFKLKPPSEQYSIYK